MSGSSTARRATIGVLFESLLGGCEEELWISITLAARAQDANLLCFVGNGVLADAEALYAMAAGPGVDAIIAVSNAMGAAWPDALERILARFAPRPLVSIGKSVPGAANLITDGGEGTRAIVEHLVTVHGRRRVAFIGGPAQSEEAEERLRGYRQALAAHGLPFRPELVMPGDFRRPLAVEAIHAWHQQGTAFDALVCANDFMAIHAMRELQLLGRRVPEDVALAGFDDIPETIAVTPTLTTARQPLRAMGKEAVRTALAMIRGEAAPDRILFPAGPVVRRSCGCLPGAQARASRRRLPPAPAGAGPRVSALAEQLEAAFPELEETVQLPAWALHLLDELARELRGQRGDRLTRFLEELISRFDPRRGIAGQCREVVDTAFELLSPEECGVAPEAWRAVREDTLAAVASLVEQRQMRFSVLRAEGYKGVVENYYWNVLLDEHELWKALQTGLSELGIESLLVARYAEGRRERAELTLRFGASQGPAVELTRGAFAPAALVDALLSPDRRCDLVLFSLLPSTGQEGFALFETVAQRAVPDPSLVHELRRRLSVTALMSELTHHAGELEARVAERTRQLQEAQTKLLDAAHQAGMAEIAVGALHNVGNLLNSVSVSAESAAELLDGSKLDGLFRANELLRGHEADLGGFFARDPRARLLPAYYAKLATGLAEERTRIRGSLSELLERTGLIRETIRNLQEYAHNGLDMLLREETELSAIVELALEVHETQLARDGVRIDREYDRDVPRLILPRAKIVHVMVNLVKNALDALTRTAPAERRLGVQVCRAGEKVQVRIRDSGEGIPPENRGRLFTYGFTTKADGHGFGLHTCANYVHQMGGTITGESEGPGRGATFTVTFASR